MKKFTLLALAACFSMAVSAQKAAVPRTGVRVQAEPVKTENVENAIKLLRQSQTSKLTSLKAPGLTAPKAPARAGEADGIITEAPEGETRMYEQSGDAYYVYYGYVSSLDYSGNVGEIVYAGDNEVYIKNPISQLVTDTYLKGTIDGDVVTVTLPQPVYQETDVDGTVYTYTAERMVYTIMDETSATYVPDTESSEIKFRVEDGSIVWDEGSTEEVILGLAYDGGWTGYGDWNTVYTEMTETPLSVPAGVETEDWVLSTDAESFTVKVGFDGSDVYIGGLDRTIPDSYVKGTLSDGKVTFANGQYLGVNEPYNCFVYFVTGVGEEVWDDFYGEYYTEYTMSDNIEFSYDAENKVMTADNGSIFINSGKSRIYYIEEFDEPVIRYQKPIVGAVKPATPTITYVLDYDEYYGYGYIAFVLPGKDVDGNVLDTKKIHYNLLLDDEPFTFTPDEYISLSADMTDVPYSFTDNFDFLASGEDRTVYLYRSGFSKIGVRSTYTADDGESMDSDTAWYYVEGTGITAVEGSGADVEKVVYTDLSGRRVGSPVKGIYVKTVTYSDGTVKSMKVMKR